MSRYFVLDTLSISNNQRVLRKEEGVFPEGVLGDKLFDQYLKEGKIKEVDAKGNQVKQKDKPKKVSEVHGYDDMTKDDLIAYLEAEGVDFNKSDDKQSLYDKYLQLFA